MKLKSGLYGIYKGQEYRISQKVDGTIKIISDSGNEKAPDGFIEKNSSSGHIFFKIIRKEELEKIYEINTFAVYLGQKRSIIGGRDKCLTLVGDESEHHLGFEMFGRGEFVKRGVPISDIDEFIEEIEPFDIIDL